MYNKCHVCSCKIKSEMDDAFTYRYYLTQNGKGICKEGGTVTVLSYGIEAICEKVLMGVPIEVSNDFLDSISPYREKVLGLIEFLKENEVSPVHLVEIAGPFADEWIEDFETEAETLTEKTIFA